MTCFILIGKCHGSLITGTCREGFSSRGIFLVGDFPRGFHSGDSFAEDFCWKGNYIHKYKSKMRIGLWRYSGDRDGVGSL